MRDFQNDKEAPMLSSLEMVVKLVFKYATYKNTFSKHILQNYFLIIKQAGRLFKNV